MRAAYRSPAAGACTSGSATRPAFDSANAIKCASAGRVSSAKDLHDKSGRSHRGAVYTVGDCRCRADQHQRDLQAPFTFATAPCNSVIGPGYGKSSTSSTARTSICPTASLATRTSAAFSARRAHARCSSVCGSPSRGIRRQESGIRAAQGTRNQSLRPQALIPSTWLSPES
jgi:hypothetical protein